MDCLRCRGALPSCAGVGANLNSWLGCSNTMESDVDGSISNTDGDLISSLISLFSGICNTGAESAK